jgi:carbonic anhydrase
MKAVLFFVCPASGLTNPLIVGKKRILYNTGWAVIPNPIYQGEEMKMVRQVIVVLSAVLLLSAGAFAEEGGHHWGYSGHEGPEHWGEMNPEFRACAEGKNQSPINLTNFIEADLAPLQIDYKPGTKEILHNGHAVQVNYAGGSSITVDGHTFELKQFHFHAPSENRINGKSFPMEAHFVHADKDGNLAVIAVMMEEGSANKLMTELWKKMPGKAGDTKALDADLNASGLLPENHDYYRFNGSLTTPPCTEGVYWLVMKEPVQVSKEQVEKFEQAMHHPNNRPVQPVNARPVLK